jgi:hypothetical protein
VALAKGLCGSDPRERRLGGRVRELGRQLGVPTPASDFIYVALKPFVAGKAPVA